MYSVIGPDGNVYGPADLQTLKIWCIQGRVTPSTNIIDAVSGRAMRASDQPELLQVLQSPLSAPSIQHPALPGGGAFGSGQHRPGTSAPYQQSATGGNPYPQPLMAPRIQAPTQGGQSVGQKSKVVAAVLALCLGWLGIHRFYLGRSTTGGIMLVLWMLRWMAFRIWTMMLPMTFRTAIRYAYYIDAAQHVRTLVIIWALIDFVLILTGRLKDADGYDLA